VTSFGFETCKSSLIILQLLVNCLVNVQSLSDMFPIKNGLK
jgi:hypothetical protein